MTARDRSARAGAAARILCWIGGALVALALVFNPWLVRVLRGGAALSPEALRETYRSELLFAAAGVLLWIGGALVRRRPALLARRGVVRALLVVLGLALPIFLLERVLRPFVEQSTRAFERDRELGWRLVPDSADDWLGVPLRVNAQGLRGPVRAEAKPPGTRRVLFVGDSVVLGAFIADDVATIPAQVERRLVDLLDEPVECINAGVGGYAAWQELLYLEREGERFDPDLVVLNFVLNDVTEPLELQRFGGEGEGFQLEHTVERGPLRWLRESAISHVARDLGAKLRFGGDAQEGARRREVAGVYELILLPNEDRVQRAWTASMASLDGIVAWCRAHERELLFVAHPYQMQLADPRLNAPQWILERFAARRELPFLDLLPPLVAELEAQGGDARPEDYYVDQVHPSARGAAAIGRILAERIAAMLAPG